MQCFGHFSYCSRLAAQVEDLTPENETEIALFPLVLLLFHEKVEIVVDLNKEHQSLASFAAKQ